MASFAIVPAAGKSSRMGRSKLLLPWQGRTLLEFVVHEWLQSGVSRVIVVLRPTDHALLTLLADWDIDRVVPSTDPPEMKDSVRLALEHIALRYAPSSRDLWLLAPADLPRLSSHTVRQLLGAYRPTDPCILIPTANGRRGHPVVFPWELSAAVADLPSDRGVDALLERFTTRKVPIESDVGFDDLDDPGAYQRLLDHPPQPG
jgi:molybdenum cofactor cytidylyltransferase